MLTMVESGDVTPEKTSFEQHYQAQRGVLPGGGHDWARTLRDRAMAAFLGMGLPTRKLEDWKYTDLRRLGKLDFAPAEPVDAIPAEIDGALARADESVNALVFVNGHFRQDLSMLDALPAGARIGDLAAALEAGDQTVGDHLGRVLETGSRPMVELNTAMMRGGIVVHLAAGTAIERPIRIVHLTAPEGRPVAVYPRLLMVLEAGSSATVVEHYAGIDGAPYLNDGVTEVVVGDGARLHHYRWQQEGDQGFHLSNTLARVGRDATYDSFTLTLGGDLTRNEGVVRLDGSGSDVRVSGAYMAGGATHVDTTMLIDHTASDCRSRQVFKGVLDDAARGVFQGKITVRSEAQRTDGHQLSNALLLSPRAEMDSKPELEIFADDVKCSHGSTAGELDDQALFYLRARGIDADVARGLLIEAFVAEAIEEIADETVRSEFGDAIGEWWHRHRGGE